MNTNLWLMLSLRSSKNNNKTQHFEIVKCSIWNVVLCPIVTGLVFRLAWLAFAQFLLSIKSQNHNSFSITVSIGIWRGAKAYVVTFFYFCYIRYLLGQCQKESTKYCLTCEFRNKLRAKKTMSLNPPTMNALSFSCWNRSIHMHQAWWPSGLLSWGT